jgi:hypothetical protein
MLKLANSEGRMKEDQIEKKKGTLRQSPYLVCTSLACSMGLGPEPIRDYPAPLIIRGSAQRRRFLSGAADT